MIDQVVAFAMQQYMWIIAILFVWIYYLWKIYTISGNIWTITQKGGVAEKNAQERLFRIGIKALPELERMNEILNAQIKREVAAGDARFQRTLSLGTVADPVENRMYLQILLDRRRSVQETIARINSGNSISVEPSPGQCQLAIPPDWQQIPSARSAAGHMEFSGPNGNFIRFAIGPYSPEPTVYEQQRNLAKFAEKHGHSVLSIGEIEVAGKKHATMTCKVPTVGILKNYSLIFDEIEYLVTAKGDMQLCDSIVKTFKTA